MKPSAPIASVISLAAAALLPVVAAWLLGCNGGAPRVRGSGVVQTEQRDATGFSEIRLSGSGEVDVRHADTQSVTVEAEDNILPLLETRVRDGTLSLGARPNVNISPTRPIRYQITVKRLTAIGVSGSGRFVVEGLDTPRLSAEISGSGSATFSGRADDVRLTISGSGEYDAARLTSKTARVEISGSGSATVNATDRVEANVIGSGSVRYIGNPSVDQRVSGSGSVRRTGDRVDG